MPILACLVCRASLSLFFKKRSLNGVKMCTYILIEGNRVELNLMNLIARIFMITIIKPDMILFVYKQLGHRVLTHGQHSQKLKDLSCVSTL